MLRKLDNEVMSNFFTRRKFLQFAEPARPPSRQIRQQAQLPLLQRLVGIQERLQVPFVAGDQPSFLVLRPASFPAQFVHVKIDSLPRSLNRASQGRIELLDLLAELPQ